MAKISTKRLLAEKALQSTCGQECVDWAIGMLEQGKESHSLLRLAGLLPPLNHFEVAALRDQALCELGIENLAQDLVVQVYSAELLRSATDGQTDLIEALRAVSDLCIANNYEKEIFDFSLLYWAYDNLRYEKYQYYWPGATRETIVPIILGRIERFLADHPSSD